MQQLVLATHPAVRMLLATHQSIDNVKKRRELQEPTMSPGSRVRSNNSSDDGDGEGVVEIASEAHDRPNES